MDLESIRFFASLGVGGLLAGLVFLAYREDFKKERAQTRLQLERDAARETALLAIIQQSTATGERIIGAIDRLEATLGEQYHFLIAAQDRAGLALDKILHDTTNLVGLRRS